MGAQLAHLFGALLGAVIATGGVYALPLPASEQHLAYTGILIVAYMLGVNLPPPNSAFDPKTGVPRTGR